ncbi:MAG: transketolase family protein [Deltaproteobacteria bacterium]|nr:transketolase family protein [Deltaproteobacteria bacterium]MBI3293787.1 transketolase family protein [Deltaproteobacteria bacterium]
MNKATRDSFGEAVKMVGSTDPKVVVLDADLSVSTKSILFAKEFPDRFFQMGIAEQNMIGTAAGLAFAGYTPFLCSFGCFLAGRYETIRVSVGYSRANVKMVGTHSGLGTGEDGYTQMGLEDVTVLSALPGLTILQPSDHLSTVAAVRFAASHVGPVYLRLTRQKLPALYQSEHSFQMGRATILKEGRDIALIGTGSMVHEMLAASQLLQGVNPWIIDMHTLKPIDRSLIKSLGNSCKWIVTAEDHSTIGGLGTAVGTALAEMGASAKLIRIGVEDRFGESGPASELYEKYGLSAKRVAERVRSLL